MKERFRSLYDKIFYTPKPLPSGHFQTSSLTDDGSPLRMHLRIEKDGAGILILNASTILHLNATATEIAFHMVNNTPDEQAIQELVKRYKVDAETAKQDILEFKERLHSIIHTPDLDPETFLDVSRVALHSQEISAPLRLDCALTYQMSDGSSSIYAPVNRVTRNLDTTEWKQIINKAWQVGIPHIVFTGGEPTIRPDLPELLQAAENNGQITGLITDGLRFTEKEYLHQLLQSGLDHVLFILSPEENQSWEALRDIMGEDIFVTVHLTLSSKNISKLPHYLAEIKKLDVKSLSISSESKEAKELLKGLTHKAAEFGLPLVWDLPVPYSANNPVSAELENSDKGESGAGKTWLYLEPDGDVLPAQGINHVLGNFLTDPWESIWLNASK